MWFNCVLATDIGVLAPSVGLSLFYVMGIVPEIDPSIAMENLYRPVYPFVGCLIIAMIVVILFPPLATWLPSLIIKGQ